MPNVRLLPPIDRYTDGGLKSTQLTASDGTIYRFTAGTPFDANAAHAEFLAGNGCIPVGTGGGRGSGIAAQVGPTSARPTSDGGRPIAQGTQFVDTTIEALIVFDGLAWRNAYSGAAV